MCRHGASSLVGREEEMCERYRRTRKEKREQNEWMLTRTLTSIFFSSSLFFSLALSFVRSLPIFLLLPVCHRQRTSVFVSFFLFCSSCTCCVRRNDVGKEKTPPIRCFSFYFFASCSHLNRERKKGSFFIMRAMKDDVRCLT